MVGLLEYLVYITQSADVERLSFLVLIDCFHHFLLSFAFVYAFCHSHHQVILPPIFRIGLGNIEGNGLLIIHSQGGVLDVLAKTHYRIIIITDGLIDSEPGV